MRPVRGGAGIAAEPSPCDDRRPSSPVPSSPLDSVASALPSPEHQAYAGELQRVLEEAVDALPEPYRVVFMLRDVEGHEHQRDRHPPWSSATRP